MIQLTIPVTYKISDYMEKKYKDRFTNRSCKKTQETFRIEKVLKRQEDKCLVEWMGYPKSFNYWIITKTILKLTTKKSH